VQFDLDKTAGRNPLADLAAEISLFPQQTAEDDELDEMRGEPEGWVTHEEGMRRMRQAAGGSAAPSAPLDTLTADADGNVVGTTLTAEQPGPGESAGANAPGSFESFMTMFGGGGTPAPRGPVPS
jgi:hypothetical protein